MGHTRLVKNLDPITRERLWQIAPIGTIVLIRLLRDLGAGGGWWGKLGGEALLIVGWILGQVLTELDHVFYVSVCNPQELTCQRIKSEIDKRNWRNAWGLLQRTKGEREKLPVRNMLTVAVILGLGIWVISSNANFMAMGVILGLTFRLLSEVLAETNFRKWYWIFAREFSIMEHRGFLIAWGLVLVWEVVRVILI